MRLGMLGWTMLLVAGCSNDAPQAAGPRVGDEKKTAAEAALGNDELPQVKEDVAPDGGEPPVKLNAATATAPAANAPSNPAPVRPVSLPKGPLVKATYAIKVAASILDDLSLCEGEADLIVNADMTVTIPRAKIACLMDLCEIDLTKILSTMNSDLVNPEKLLKNLKKGSKILTVGEISGGTFTPARPMLISPFSQKASELVGINETYSGSLSNPKTGEKANGTIVTKVLSANASEVRWSMAANGWDGVDKMKYALIKELEITWGMKPIGIPKIRVVAPVEDALSATGLDKGNTKDLLKMCTGSDDGALGGLLEAAGDNPLFGAFTDLTMGVAKKLDAVTELTLVKQEFLTQQVQP